MQTASAVDKAERIDRLGIKPHQLSLVYLSDLAEAFVHILKAKWTSNRSGRPKYKTSYSP